MNAPQIATPPPTMSVATLMAEPSVEGCDISQDRAKSRTLPIGTSPGPGATLATPSPTENLTMPMVLSSVEGCEISQDRAKSRPLPIGTAPGPGALRTPSPATPRAIPSCFARVEEYDALNLPLLLLAENLTDIEGVRMAMANRLRQFEGSESFGDIERLRAVLDGMAKLEHDVVLHVQRAMRAHPLGPWVKRSKGVGEKQAARLLAAIGNPYWNSLHDRPRRGPAELWAYCGYHVLPAAGHGSSGPQGLHAGGGQPSATLTDQSINDTQVVAVGGVAPKRRKGQRSNWNGAARTRAYLVAESCMKSPGGEYRAVYDAGRAKYLELPAGHAHNRALRLVAKAVLRDIWIEAKAWHEATG